MGGTSAATEREPEGSTRWPLATGAAGASGSPEQAADAAGPAQVWSAVRILAGPVAVVAGIVLSALGWYGVAGESIPAKQIPYLASASIPGAALLIAGAILLAAGRRRAAAPPPVGAETARMVAELHALLVEVVDADAPGRAAASGPGPGGPVAGDEGEAVVWAVPSGSRYHRASCTLLAGKPEAFPLRDGPAAHPELTPCPVCTPPVARRDGDDAPRVDGSSGVDGTPTSGGASAADQAHGS